MDGKSYGVCFAEGEGVSAGAAPEQTEPLLAQGPPSQHLPHASRQYALAPRAPRVLTAHLPCQIEPLFKALVPGTSLRGAGWLYLAPRGFFWAQGTLSQYLPHACE